MPISAEELKDIVAEFLKAQQSGNTASNESTIASLNSRLPVFRYDPDRDDTFSAYYDRYGKIIAEDGGKLTGPEKVRLLVGKLDKAEYNRFSDSIKPDGPYDKDFDTTVGRLQALFAPVRSLVMKRYEFFSLSRSQGSDLIEFSTRLNASCELASPPLKADQLKCLRFVPNLQDYPDLRSRLIQFLENKEADSKEPTFDEFMAERNFKRERKPQKKDHNRSSKSSHGSHAKGHGSHAASAKNTSHGSTAKKPTKPCRSCGGNHWRNDCKWKDAKCNSSGATGHISTVYIKSKTVKTGHIQTFATTAADQIDRTGNQHASPKGYNGSKSEVNYNEKATHVRTDAPLHCSKPAHVDLKVQCGKAQRTMRFS
ncbi:hypothetical protein AAVH_08728 [Aphelenchoides avenae]|nr:hypothetical protein AAVH_08728 [Aphelenchus avenae]